MKLSQYKEDYYFYSGESSKVGRAAALGGIGIIWIFRIVSKDGTPAIPRELFFPTAFFALSLVFDLLQYIAGTLIWGHFFRWNERRLSRPTDDPDLSHRAWFSLPISIFFWSKLVSVGIGYVCLVWFLRSQWSELGSS